jgi:hypothetical protein
MRPAGRCNLSDEARTGFSAMVGNACLPTKVRSLTVLAVLLLSRAVKIWALPTI